MNDQSGIELGWIFSVVRRNLRLIIGLTVLALVVAIGATSFMKPVYSANATLMVQPAQDSRSTEVNLLAAGERLALTYSQVLKGRPVMEKTVEKLGLNISATTLAEQVIAEPVKDTQLIRVTVTDSSAERAALLANTIAEVFIEQVQALNNQRYSSTIVSMTNNLTNLEQSILTQDEKIRKLSTENIAEDVELERLNNLLVEYRDDYNVLQRTYQDLQLAAAQASENIRVVEDPYPTGLAGGATSTATTILLVGEVASSVAGAPVGAIPSTQIASTYEQILLGNEVLQKTTSDLSLTDSIAVLKTRIRVEPVFNTQMIRISADAPTQEDANLLVSTVTSNFINHVQAVQSQPYNSRLTFLESQMKDLQTKISGVEEQVKVSSTNRFQRSTEIENLNTQVLTQRNDYRSIQQDLEAVQLTSSQASDSIVISEPAYEPRRPSENRIQYIGIAALVGLILGIGLTFLLEMLEDRIRIGQDISARLGYPLLGTVGELSRGQELVVGTRSTSTVIEDFRKLAINLRLASTNNPFSILVVTSPVANEGKSVVAANLAVAMARTGLNVILVDADLRSSRLHEVFGLPMREGLTDAFLRGSAESSLQPTVAENLQLLTSGQNQLLDFTELLNSPRLPEMLRKLALRADLVIVDSPPLTVGDSRILASVADGVLLVVRSGVSQGHEVREAAENLRQAHANLVGVILNAQPGTTPSSSRALDRLNNARITANFLNKPYAALSRFFNRGR